jgi:hypothetical protein
MWHLDPRIEGNGMMQVNTDTFALLSSNKEKEYPNEQRQNSKDWLQFPV